jgi:hypothetical protein
LKAIHSVGEDELVTVSADTDEDTHEDTEAEDDEY